MVDHNLADWINRAKAIRLKSYSEEIRGDSCAPGKRIIYANAAKNREAMDLIQAWPEI